MYTWFRLLKINHSLLPLSSLISFTLPFFSEKPATELIKERFNAAKELSSDLNFKDAEDSFHDLIHFASKKFEQNKLDEKQLVEIKCRIFVELGNLYMLKGDYKRAQESFIYSMKSAIGVGIPQTDPMVLMISLKLALIYEEIGQNNMARKGFQFIIDHFLDLDREIDENEQALLGMTYDYYAKHLFKVKEYKKSLAYAQKSQKYCHNVYSSQHENCLNLLLDIALIQFSMNEKENALLHLEDFFRILDKLDRIERDKLSLVEYSAILQLAKLEISQKKYENAIKSLQRVDFLNIKENNFNLDQIKELRLIQRKLAYEINKNL